MPGPALKLRRGDDALAIIKSTEVMIARSGAAARRDVGNQESETSLTMLVRRSLVRAIALLAVLGGVARRAAGN